MASRFPLAWAPGLAGFYVKLSRSGDSTAAQRPRVRNLRNRRTWPDGARIADGMFRIARLLAHLRTLPAALRAGKRSRDGSATTVPENFQNALPSRAGAAFWWRPRI